MTVLQKILKKLEDEKVYTPGKEVARNWLLMDDNQIRDTWNSAIAYKRAIDYDGNDEQNLPDLETYINQLKQKP